MVMIFLIVVKSFTTAITTHKIFAKYIHGLFEDCNENFLLDTQEIESGSYDRNQNGLIDACEIDLLQSQLIKING